MTTKNKVESELARDFSKFILKTISRGARHTGRFDSLRPLSRQEAGAVELIGRLQPISMGAIAEILHLSNSAASMLINQLDKKGLVSRRRDPENRRSVLIELTESGRVVLGDLARSQLAMAEEILCELDPESQKFIVQMARQVTKAWTEADAPAS